MAQTITPVVHGGSRRRWGLAVALHTLGATVAGAAFGAALGGLGAALGADGGRPWLAAVAVIAAIYVARELAGLRWIPVPAARRQVPEWWRAFFAPHVGALLYGLGLGIGYFTFLSFGTLVVVTAAAVALGSPLWGAVVMGSFGLARGLSILVAWGVTSREGAARLSRRLDALGSGPSARVTNGIASAAVALAAGAAAGAAGGGLELARPASVVLVVAFAWAGLAKIVDPQGWRRALSGYRLGRPLEGTAALAVPGMELAVVGLSLAGLPLAAGALALGLLVAFSGAILRARAGRGRRLPCGCFGRTRSRDYRVLLARNALLMATAAIVALEADPVLALPRIGWDDAAPAALALAGMALAVGMLRAAVPGLRRRTPASHRA